MINYFIDGSAAPSAAPFQSTAAAGRVHSGALLTVPIAAGFIVNPFHDSLNLHACGAAKLLTDSAGDNCPHPMNRKVPIGYEGTVPATAVLFDSNGEGHLDKITVRWAVPFELDSFPPMPKNAFDSMSITTFDGNRSDLWASDKKTADARSFSYNLIETQGALLQTGWKDATIRINSQIKFQERFSLDVDSIIDSAGPVIQSAELRLYGVSGKKGPDTLIVTFDEPVRIPAGQPFLPSDLLLFFREGSSIPEKAAFAGIDSMKYRFIGNDSCIQASVVLSNNLIVAPDHDSVSLRRHENALYCATDVSAANNPPHPANRRVAIKRCQACAHAQVDLVQNAFACENPFIPGESRIPPSLWPSIAGSVPSTGTRIEVDLKNGVVADGGVNGSVEIFDVVGNLIVGSKAMHGYAKNLYFYWDGKNDHGMTVSQGLYLAIVKVAASGTSGESISKIKIGVKYRKGN
jgi:hypothetical protein